MMVLWTLACFRTLRMRVRVRYITLHYTFAQSMSYSHIIDYLGKQFAEFNEHKYA